MILNFSWFVLIKRYVSFDESRLKFLLSILTQDLGIIFIGGLYDYTHHHHTYDNINVVPLNSLKNASTVNKFIINHKNQLKKYNVNSAFKISFQCMFIVTLIAMYCCQLLKFRKEIVITQEYDDDSMIPINYTNDEHNQIQDQNDIIDKNDDHDHNNIM